jgi:CHAT domain-containing protein
LLVGVSQFGDRAAELTSAIPSLDLVQRRWPGVTHRLEERATTRATLHAAAAAGELRRFGLIHIATHGQLTSGHGGLAHLKLADDDLLADEVAQLNLGGALVVLAACEGALGERLPGEELVSLIWALLASGDGNVVASLWQLYDLMLLPIL